MLLETCFHGSFKHGWQEDEEFPVSGSRCSVPSILPLTPFLILRKEKKRKEKKRK